MKKMFGLALLLIIILISTVSIVAEAGSAAPKTLRIGLVTYFEHVDNIHMYNNEVVPGFYEEGRFIPEVFISTEGKDFSFTPTNKLYLASDQRFENYEEALKVVAPLRASGYEAYATLIETGFWKVFAGHSDSESDLEKVKSDIDGQYGLTYDQAPESFERILMESQSNAPVLFENSGRRVVFATSDTRSGAQVIDLGKRSYRGYIEIGRYGNSDLTAVNIIRLDDYLNSVVVSEVYASWPEESLKAQAVAARTFAAYYKEVARKYPNDPFDLDDTVGSQVYKGYSIEDYRVNEAVTATSGVMVYYDNRVIPTYFFAASGGRTENSENVWSGSVPYLKSVADIYETQPERKPWVTRLSSSEIESDLEQKGIDIGKVVDVEVIGYTESGRAIDLKIIGTSGSHTLKKENIRYTLGLNSRKFVVLKESYEPEMTYAVIGANGKTKYISYGNGYVVDDSSSVYKALSGQEQMMVIGDGNIINQPLISGQRDVYTFAGEGWGHGVGMSQAGAKGMANAGFNYIEILTHYYTDVTVK